MNKAFFIDRDGVVNSDEGHYYVYKIQDFSFNDDIAEALASIRKNGYKLILITNQGGRQFCDWKVTNRNGEGLEWEARKWKNEIDHAVKCEG